MTFKILKQNLVHIFPKISFILSLSLATSAYSMSINALCSQFSKLLVRLRWINGISQSRVEILGTWGLKHQSISERHQPEHHLQRLSLCSQTGHQSFPCKINYSHFQSNPLSPRYKGSYPSTTFSKFIFSLPGLFLWINPRVAQSQWQLAHLNYQMMIQMTNCISAISLNLPGGK